MTRPALLRRVAFGVLAFALILTGATQSAHAQVWGVWGDPAPTPSGSWFSSAHFLVGDVVGIMGQARFPLGGPADIGVQVGIPDFDDSNFAFAADYRHLFLPASDDFPVDIAFDGAFGLIDLDFGKIWDFDFGAIVSKSIASSTGQRFVPYGSLMIAIGRLSTDSRTFQGPFGTVNVGGASSTDTDVNFRFGLAVPLEDKGVTLNGELHASSRDITNIYFSFGAGIDM